MLTYLQEITDHIRRVFEELKNVYIAERRLKRNEKRWSLAQIERGDDL